MAATSAERSGGDAYALVRELHLAGKTGTLELEREEGSERVFWVSGDLYTPADHPLGEAARSAPGGEADLDDPLLVEAVSAWLDAARGAAPRFRRGVGGIASDLVGPMPVKAGLMRAAVAGREEFELLKQLGGEESRLVAAARAVDLERGPPLATEEAFFLSRLDRPATVKELLRQTDLERPQALAALCRLEAVALVVRAEAGASQESARLLTTEMLERFSERIEATLAQSPLSLTPEAHRERLGELMGRLGELNHYELLEVDFAASDGEIHDAYLRLGRTVHPSHAEHLGFGGREAGLRLLFERATEAYLVLSDRDRRRAYLDEIGSEGLGARQRVEGGARDSEQREQAARHYRTARGLAQREEYHFAIELLNQAVRADPRPEYFRLLADCQSINPNWLRKAIFNYSKAAQLSPDDPTVRVDLARAYERVGNRAAARIEYEAALEKIPGYPEAIDGLKRLARPRGAGGEPGPLRRWLRRLIGR